MTERTGCKMKNNIIDYVVYDKVWVMRGSTPTQMIVFATVDEMSWSKLSTERYYLLVHSRVGASHSIAICYTVDKMFDSKQELLASL